MDDATFKRMAIDLSYARGSVNEVADELDIDPDRLSKWLQKELKVAQLERDILKKAMSISRIKSGIFDSPGETGGIRIHKRAPKPISLREEVPGALSECQWLLLLSQTSS